MTQEILRCLVVRSTAILSFGIHVFAIIVEIISDTASGWYNDEKILNEICDKNVGRILDHFDVKEDEIIVDRGFSRCKVPFKLHFPRSVGSDRDQLSTRDANMCVLMRYLSQQLTVTCCV